MDDVDLVLIFCFPGYSFSFVHKGVVICVTSLVMAMAQDHLAPFAVCYTKAVDRLHRVSYTNFLFFGLLLMLLSL
jgi:hypothetical protein